ncbi:MAG: hypothetical protein J6Y91_02070 [Alphaproteobacteria bacterium]|nr:hypothetical protein [Alphaproteobacteria bacterium]
MDMDFALFQQMAEQKMPDDNSVAARFYDKAVKTAEVNANGLPIFQNKTYVEIRLKDNNTEVFNQPATAEKIKRFPREYTLYQMAKKQVQQGTPLEQFAFLDAAEVATCKNRGVFTVEALAGLESEKVKTLGLDEEHKMAVLFLKNAKQNGALQKISQQEETYQNEITALKEKIAWLEGQLARQSDKSRRGRKKGEDA